MGFFDSIMENLQKEQGKYQKKVQKRAKEILREKGSSLSSEQKSNLEKHSKGTTFSTSTSSSTKMGREKPLSDWESKWESIGVLSSVDLSPFSSSVGVYKASLSGEVVYIGRAIEFENGGFRKRLSDYRRKSDSARKHKSGKLMYENAGQLRISIIETGSDSDAAKIAKQLERMLVAKYNPKWNTMLKSKVL